MHKITCSSCKITGLVLLAGLWDCGAAPPVLVAFCDPVFVLGRTRALVHSVQWHARGCFHEIDKIRFDSSMSPADADYESKTGTREYCASQSMSSRKPSLAGESYKWSQGERSLSFLKAAPCLWKWNVRKRSIHVMRSPSRFGIYGLCSCVGHSQKGWNQSTPWSLITRII